MAKSRSEQLADQARFVFQGTVKQVKASTFKETEVPINDRTTIVRVDQVIQAPEALAGYAGHDVTVQLDSSEKPVKAGDTFVFYTNGWIFGDSIAVLSIGHEDATMTTMATLSSHPDDPVRSLQSREAMTQVASADLIVSGRVSAVRLPTEEAQARVTAASTGRTNERISEHAPLWQEAVIDVDEVHKGHHTKKQVVVRFPSSTDVRWHKAPKFHTDQEGVFLLHKKQLAKQHGGATVAAEAGVGPDEYTALDSADIQPLEELSQIKRAAQTGNS